MPPQLTMAIGKPAARNASAVAVSRAHRAFDRRRLLRGIGDLGRMSFPPGHTDQSQAGQRCDRVRQLESPQRHSGDTGTPHPGVDLDQHRQAHADRSAAAAAMAAAFSGVVDQHLDLGVAVQAGQAAIFDSPTIWLAIRMSRMPAAAITSASPSLAQVTPMAPAASALVRDRRVP